jgi:predicted glycoside hydrolase/deacetylase ChbG (UPF0249 family)
MPARLILNADDFGLTPGINRAIGELSAAGVLTSATLMAAGTAFEDAVQVARAHPGLGIGCHIVLTDGMPVAAPDSIRSLLGPDRCSFRPRLSHFLQALFTGRVRSDDILREALAQIEKLQRAGIRITHLDTHKHTHLFPMVWRPLLDAAERTGIHAIRSAFEPAWSQSLAKGGTPRRVAVRAVTLLKPAFDAAPQLRSQAVRTTDGTIAISATGSLDAESLAELLQALPDSGTYELCCHPGYNDADLDRVTTRLREHRNTEREALLTDVSRRLTQPDPPELISYGQL